MKKRTNFEKLQIITNNYALLWKKSRGYAPDSVADKLDIAMLKWQYELTETLKIWIDKGLSLTDGELILARANIGAVVESWLKFFYCIYYEDYLKNPVYDNKGKIIDPEKLGLEKLKKISTGILWENEDSIKYKWVESVQLKRNAIHSFRYRDIGTPLEFLGDIEYLYQFVKDIVSRFPPIEDFLSECGGIYPDGYIHNVYFD